jgi:hypothetical protein
MSLLFRLSLVNQSDSATRLFTESLESKLLTADFAKFFENRTL